MKKIGVKSFTFFAIFMLAALLANCAEDQQQAESNDEIEANDDEQAAGIQESENYSQGQSSGENLNNAEDEDLGGDDFSDIEQNESLIGNGEEVNSSSADDIHDSNNAANAMADGGEYSDSTEAPSLDTSINTVADQAAAGQCVNCNAPIQPHQSRQTAAGNRQHIVKYVMSGGAQLHAQPSADVIGNLEQGDHPLVFQEGEWSRTSDGKYIPSYQLTNEPVGRSRNPSLWQ